SSSDFIYAIIVEEYGLVGAALIVFVYFLLLFRIFIIVKKATTIFGTLLVVGVGLPIIFQAGINMAVATNLFPVTGQTLPLISSGGTSIWMTCFALGMILSVSASKAETEETILDDNPLDILHEAID
ncbi:MAG: FtsW/RodA/SpoVE family cell cycle protein, partial [Flavobacteriaceae bacterium]|nr:FtsW/RodA/SpoVE family cell cycle protein [Flavobacteriaceae bacterium]